MTTFDTMAAETIWEDEEWYLDGDVQEASYVSAGLPLPPELVLFVAVGFVLLAGVTLVMSQPQATAPDTVVQNEVVVDTAVLPNTNAQTEDTAVPVAPPAIDAASFTAVYDDYIITQGPHGASYGHYAIDLAAGNGEPIKSPIHGTVTAHYTDEWGNTTLVIENDVYVVMFLHGLYSVTMGQEIAQGEVLGTESNQGNTYDMAGNSCRGRNCGYHTHLNVFDKRLGQNVNPLDLF